MLSELTIPQEKPAEPALNQETLYALGREHVVRLSKRVWTDYNVHDPGVTTLELLCYALTDLGYRASFPVKDLLASAENNAAEMKKQFFTARQILPNRPLTLPDYRKLLIDLKDVKNAWLKPAGRTFFADTFKGELMWKARPSPAIHPVEPAGIYDVLLDYTEGLSEKDQDAALASARERLHANRNLCVDFAEFEKVKTQEFIICAELELAPEADTTKVHAEICFKVQQHLAPAVANYTLTEMLARKHKDGTALTVDEIFDGPALDCGFIDDAELAAAELRSEIRLSDVISVIMDIEGVRAVRKILLSPARKDANVADGEAEEGAAAGTPNSLTNKWTVEIEEGKKACLNPDKSRLIYYKRNMPVKADREKAGSLFKEMEQAARAKAETAVPYDFDIPPGRFRGPAAYHSFQHHFPALYGLSDQGLSSGAGETRKAQALQLKGYLLFFDQIMANYFAQLSRVKDLLAADPALKRTSFAQVVEHFVDAEKIYFPGPLPSLENALEDAASFAVRRNRFLDHLIARFAERFTDFANIMYAEFNTDPAALIPFKCGFLRDYPAISSERSLAYNYALKEDAGLWDSTNVSGLEKRLAKLLGIRNCARRNLGEITYDDHAGAEPVAGGKFRWRVQDRKSGAVLLRSSSSEYATAELATADMQTAISFALLPQGYQRKEEGGKHFFSIVDSTGTILAQADHSFEKAEEMEQAITALVECLQTCYSDEGMYVIEPILFRPATPSDPFLKICPDPGCDDCRETDPYSNRLHIILPAYASRFANMDFRRFTEEVIREETPAHILPRICWIDRDHMITLEKAYRDWIHLRAGAKTVDRTGTLKTFIDKLSEVRNVYPPGQLTECGSGEDQPKFLLGQNTLGVSQKKT